MHPDNDYRDYLEHSIKGQTWKNHKYLYKDQWGRYVYPEDRQEEISNKRKRSPSGLLKDVYGQDKNASRLLRGVDTSKLKFKKSTGVSKNLNYGNAKKNSSLFKDSNKGNGSSLMREVDTSKLKFKKSTGVSKNLNFGNAKKNSSLFKDLNEYSLSKRAKKGKSGISLSERVKERYKVRSKNNNESLLSKRTKNKRSGNPLSDRVKARYKSKRSS